MPVTEAFVAEAGEALSKHCPLVSQDAYASAQVRTKILDYVEKLGFEPSVELVVRFALPIEQELQEQKAKDDAEARRQAGRDARIHRDMNLPSDVDRAEAVAELRALQSKPSAREFTPRKNFTDAEIESMDSATYRREILGVPESDNNRSVGPANAFNESLGPKPIKRTRRQQSNKTAFDARRSEEEQVRQARVQEIAFDKAQKAKVRADLKAALTKAGQ
jgi:hypothetical protein